CHPLLGAAGVTSHLPHGNAEHVLEYCFVDIRRGAGRRRTHVELLGLLQVIEGLDASSAPGVAGAQIASDAADEGDLCELESELVGAEQRLVEESRVEGGDDATVCRRAGVQIFHSLEARSPTHVLHDDVRLAWNMTGYVPGQNASVGVVATPRRRADHYVDGFK